MTSVTTTLPDGRVVRVDDATGYELVGPDGLVIESRAELTDDEAALLATVADEVEVDNLTAAERDKARLAFAALGDYLALSPPTQAQVVAQVRLLTRAVRGLMRLALSDLVRDTDPEPPAP